MNWAKASKYVLVADDGLHKVVKVIVVGVPRYELWRDRELVSGGHATADAAKAAAESA